MDKYSHALQCRIGEDEWQETIVEWTGSQAPPIRQREMIVVRRAEYTAPGFDISRQDVINPDADDAAARSGRARSDPNYTRPSGATRNPGLPRSDAYDYEALGLNPHQSAEEARRRREEAKEEEKEMQSIPLQRGYADGSTADTTPWPSPYKSTRQIVHRPPTKGVKMPPGEVIVIKDSDDTDTEQFDEDEEQIPTYGQPPMDRYA